MNERARLAVALEVRSTDDDARTFEGYGSVFGTLDTYADTIKKGAFRRSLKEWKAKNRMPAMLWQHNADEPVGAWTEMAEDETGLHVKGKLLSTGRGPQAYEALKVGALSGLSIGFVTRKAQIDEESGVRTLLDVDLWEVSLVTFPANDPARVTSVRAESEMPSEREFEQWLRRDAGLSREEAKRVTATCYRRLLRDAGTTDVDPLDIAGRHVEGSHEALIALRSVISGVPAHGPGSQGPDRSDRA